VITWLRPTAWSGSSLGSSVSRLHARRKSRIGCRDSDDKSRGDTTAATFRSYIRIGQIVISIRRTDRELPLWVDDWATFGPTTLWKIYQAEWYLKYINFHTLKIICFYVTIKVLLQSMSNGKKVFSFWWRHELFDKHEIVIPKRCKFLNFKN
jgi:hypothetical protein